MALTWLPDNPSANPGNPGNPSGALSIAIPLAESVGNRKRIVGSGFCAADDFCVNVKIPGDTNRFLCSIMGNVDLHAMAHIEYLVHFFPIRSRCLLDGGEQRGRLEQVIFDEMHLLAEPQAFCLRASRAMNNSL